MIFVENLPGYSAEKLTFECNGLLSICSGSSNCRDFPLCDDIAKTALFGVLKAQGVSTGYLVRSIVGQSLIVSIAGVFDCFWFSAI